MNNPFDEMREAILGAQLTLRAADNSATYLAEVLRGRLRLVKDTEVLKTLKRELQDFDATRQEWRERK
jgi:hypothetical protein